MLVIKTESGSIYHIKDDMVRRVEHTHDLRRDGDWIRILNRGEVIVGKQLQMMLEPLGGEDCLITSRMTSTVISVEEVDDETRILS